MATQILKFPLMILYLTIHGDISTTILSHEWLYILLMPLNQFQLALGG